MPRVFHAGVKGTFMDLKTHNQYFARIAVNMDSQFRWTSEAGATAVKQLQQDLYKQTLRSEVQAATPLTTVADIARFNSGIGVVWFSHTQKLVAYKQNQFKDMAAYFGIWHEPHRGARDSVHRIHWLGNAVLYLINAPLNTELRDIAPTTRME